MDHDETTKKLIAKDSQLQETFNPNVFKMSTDDPSHSLHHPDHHAGNPLPKIVSSMI